MTKTDAFQQFSGHLQSVSSGITKGLRERGVNLDEALKAAAQPEGAWAIVKIVDALAGVVEVETIHFCVHVNYNLTVAEMVAAGKYDWANSDISFEHFPPDPSRPMTESVCVEIVRYGCPMSNEDIDRDFEKRGLRNATLPELLALGAEHPDEQRNGAIAARGSVWHGSLGDRGVAYLCRAAAGSGRGLDLRWIERDWQRWWRFAAVRKPR